MQWLLYALGSFGYSVIYTAMMQMYLYRYDPGEPNPYNFPVLASSALVGIAALVGRIFNPFVSIFIGYLSDKTRTPWGRRRPFMAIAILPMLVGFILVFTPPIPHISSWNVVYLTVTSIVFLLSYSAYITPYQALMPEIAQTASQRVRLSTLIAFLSLLGFALGSIAAPWLLERFNFVSMALILSAIAFVSLIAPLAVKEDLKIPRSKHLPFWKSVQTVQQNFLFRPYIVSQIFMWMTINIIFLCSNYLVVALFNRDIAFGSAVNGIILIGVLIGFVPVNWLVKQIGKKATLQAFLILLSFNLVGLGIWSVWAKNILWLSMTLILFSGIGMSGLLLLPAAILADIIDEGTKQTGIQQGAIYFGIQAMVVTITSGFASVLTGFILMLGKTSMQPLGVQLVYPIAGFIALLSAFALASLPLKK